MKSQQYNNYESVNHTALPKIELYNKIPRFWSSLPRADDPLQNLTDKAIILASALQFKLRLSSKAIVNHTWISSITGRLRRQNTNIMKQLENIFIFKFHKVYGKSSDVYTVEYQEYGEAILLGKRQNAKVINLPVQNQQTSAIIALDYPRPRNALPDPYIYIEKTNIKNIDSESTFFETSQLEKKNSEVHNGFVDLDSILKKFPTAESLDMQGIQEEHEALKIFSKLSTATVPTVPKEVSRKGGFRAFHPLTHDQTALINLRTNRSYSNHFMNQLILAMAKKQPHTSFWHEKQFMAYFEKMIKNEIRPSHEVNDLTYILKRNMNEEELNEKWMESHLAKIEMMAPKDDLIRLKQKLVARANTKSAFKLVKVIYYRENFKKDADMITAIEVCGNAEITMREQDIIKNAIEEIYGNQVKIKFRVKLLTEGEVESLSLIPMASAPKEAPIALKVPKKPNEELWGIMWDRIAVKYSPGHMVSWFSKIRLTTNGTEYVFKCDSDVIRYYVRQNYDIVLEEILCQMAAEGLCEKPTPFGIKWE